MKKIILMFILTFLFFNIIYGVAEIRNLYVTGNCYTPGQYIAVNFEVRCSAWQAVYGDIIFSTNPTSEFYDDAVLTSEGIQYPPDNDGHNGIRMQEQGSDGNVWYKKRYTVKVPEWYNGEYYIIVNIAENYMQLWDWGGHIENSASILIMKCQTPTVSPTFTPVVTATVPSLQDIWNRYDQQQNQIRDITASITVTAGTQSNFVQYFFKQHNKYKYLDTTLAGLEAAYNGTTLTTKDKVSNVIHSIVVAAPRIINKIDVINDYRNLTNAVIDFVGTTINEKGQQSVLLAVQYTIDRHAQWIFGFNDQQIILFDYTEGVVRRITSKYNGTTRWTVNYYYSIVDGILVPASRYTIDVAGNTVSSETFGNIRLNQGFPDSILQVTQ